MVRSARAASTWTRLTGSSRREQIALGRARRHDRQRHRDSARALVRSARRVSVSKKLAEPSGAMLPTSETSWCWGSPSARIWSTAARSVRPVPIAMMIGVGPASFCSREAGRARRDAADRLSDAPDRSARRRNGEA